MTKESTTPTLPQLIMPDDLMEKSAIGPGRVYERDDSFGSCVRSGSVSSISDTEDAEGCDDDMRNISKRIAAHHASERNLLGSRGDLRVYKSSHDVSKIDVKNTLKILGAADLSVASRDTDSTPDENATKNSTSAKLGLNVTFEAIKPSPTQISPEPVSLAKKQPLSSGLTTGQHAAAMASKSRRKSICGPAAAPSADFLSKMSSLATTVDPLEEEVEDVTSTTSSITQEIPAAARTRSSWVSKLKHSFNSNNTTAEIAPVPRTPRGSFFGANFGSKKVSKLLQRPNSKTQQTAKNDLQITVEVRKRRRASVSVYSFKDPNVTADHLQFLRELQTQAVTEISVDSTDSCDGNVKTDSQGLMIHADGALGQSEVDSVPSEDGGVTAEALFENIMEKYNALPTLLNCFLLTFRHILQPKELMTMIVQRCDQLDKDKPETKTVIQFLRQWMKAAWFDFKDPDMISMVHKVEDKLISVGLNNDAADLAAACAIAGVGGAKMSVASPAIQQEGAEDGSADPTLTQDGGVTSKQNIMGRYSRAMNVASAKPELKDSALLSFDAHQVASELNRTEMKYFRMVRAQEFVMNLWAPNADQDGHKDNLDRYVEWFNQISYWVGTEVLLQPTAHARGICLALWIRVGKALLQKHSYNLLAAIVTGLSNSAVERLEESWSKVPGKQLTVYRNLQRICDPKRNFASYRQEISCAPRGAIPIFAVFMKDLVYMNELPKRIGEEGHLNMQKLLRISTHIEQIVEYQRTMTDLPAPDTEVCAYIDNMPVLPEEALYFISITAEQPKGGTYSERWKIIKTFTQMTDTAAVKQQAAGTRTSFTG
eukprot:Clim_evm29s139 gene=Clim_evmTU29s139